MKVLVLNGSPKGENSNTMKITKSFLVGMEKSTELEYEIIDISKANIGHCKGCFACWRNANGGCVIKDDMDILIKKYVQSDIVIWSMPLYFFSMPSKIKNFMDRLLPIFLPTIIENENGGCMHPKRYEKPYKTMLISSCGFWATENNCEALIKQFEIFAQDSLETIICPQGELFRVKELKGRTEEYLKLAEKTGAEYGAYGRIGTDIKKELSELLYPSDVFMKMANESWGTGVSENFKKDTEALSFTKQMAALYNKNTYDGKERVIEMDYTDIGITLQMVMGKEGCEVRENDFKQYSVKIQTPMSVWKDIAQGKYSGEQAMMEGKYKTFGDLKILMDWDRYFGIPKKEVKSEKKKTSMVFMFVMWLSIWIISAYNQQLGGAVAVVSAGMTGLVMQNREITIYDGITAISASVFGSLLCLGAERTLVVTLSYLLFGMMWLVSCKSIPLTAYYSKNNYNGDKALKNPIFIKTNKVLTFMWGALYLIIGAIGFLWMGTEKYYMVGIISSVSSACLGVFTIWFQKWYPKRVAAGK